MQERRPVVAPLSSTHRRAAALAAVALAVIGLDQLTKSLALEHLSDGSVHLWWTLRLNLHFNKGGAFGLGQDMAPVFIAAGVALLAALLVLSRRLTGKAMAVALGLIVGGAGGNLADRLLRGHDGAVIDFIDLQWWPIFNVADAAITCGAILLLLTGARDAEER